MGKRGFTQGGATRKSAKSERKRFVHRPERVAGPKKLTEDVFYDIAAAQALYDAGNWDECEPVIRRLLKRGFAQPLTYDALGSCAQFQGRIEVALECFRKAIEIDPEYIDARNRLIMILDALPTTTAEQASRERAKWWEIHGAPRYALRKPHLNSRDPERPIRVGYVSADFQFHSAATVFHRIVTRHTEQVQPFIYSSTPYNKWDHITQTYFTMPGWRNIVDWPDALVAGKIIDDRIDILVDLSNFTAHNRLPVFCYKPAPIQVTGWGYALATGFPCFDGVMTDRVVTPEASEGERPIYLPSVIDYEPMEGLPEPNPLPCLTERPTFGVFQRSLKLNAEDLEVWRQILERLPESRLIMKSHYCDSLQGWILEHFKDQAGQVELQGATSSFDHKVAYQQVDLCLDPWPQTGGVSACDALHMGVPAVTLIGPRAIQRTTASLLAQVGLQDFIAFTKDDYIDTSIRLVTSRKHELAEIRQSLRQRLAESTICAGYLDATEAAYRNLWREWCEKPLTLADARYRLEKAS